MISSSGILSTGEKKCRPMNSSGRETPSARPVIGSVEVFEPSSAPSARCGSISAKTCAFTAGSSNTASITRSAPSALAGSSVAVMRASSSPACSCVERPRETAFSSSPAEHDDLLGLEGLYPLGPVTIAVHSLDVAEDGLDHVLRDLARHEVDEVAP